MKTAIRRPQLHKPTKGMKTQLKQGLKSLKKVIARTVGPIRSEGQKYLPHSYFRTQWLGSMRGSFMPHQGPKECARRVRQMANHTHGY
jgi:hypothetical protein